MISVKASSGNETKDCDDEEYEEGETEDGWVYLHYTHQRIITTKFCEDGKSKKIEQNRLKCIPMGCV